MRADVVTLTERLVSVDTAPGLSTNPLVQLLADEARSLGALVAVQDGQHDGVPQQNLIVRFGGDGSAGLVLAGHIDTVPWSQGQRATVTPERAGSTLYGRGTCDMKGAVAAQLEAAAAQAQRLSRPLVLCWTYAEEVGCHGAVALVDQAGLLGDLRDARCIVGEPTGLVPITGHKGYGAVRFELTGRPAHSSNPWAGADASVALGCLLRNLHELREDLRGEGDPDGAHDPPCSTLNTGIVSAGSARNIVPATAQVTVEYRPLPGQTLTDSESACAHACNGPVQLFPEWRAWLTGTSCVLPLISPEATVWCAGCARPRGTRTAWCPSTPRPNSIAGDWRCPRSCAVRARSSRLIGSTSRWRLSSSPLVSSSTKTRSSPSAAEQGLVGPGLPVIWLPSLSCSPSRTL